ncbi:MAG: hypothetical protein H7841_12515 [Magnetospirillum sp. WYHS-4]
MVSVQKLVHLHLGWHRDFRERLERGEPVDPVAVGRDDLCAVGRWVYGEGMAYTGLSEYEAFKEAHAGYHASVARTAELAAEGKTDEARERCSPDGASGAASLDLIMKCGDLTEKLAAKE